MPDALVLAIDKGTSSTKSLVIDDRGQVVGRGQAPVSLATPEPGGSSRTRTRFGRACAAPWPTRSISRLPKRVVSVGLSTQRESCVIWDRRSGEALTPVLSWQDQRTERRLRGSLRASGQGSDIRRKSGLPLDPMFSAAKARWLLDRLRWVRLARRRRRSASGQSTSFILSRFGGEAVVEAGNASRTQLFDVVGGALGRGAAVDFRRARSPPCRASLRRQGRFRRRKGSAPLPDGVPVGAVHGRFPFRTLRPRRLCAGAGQGDARHRLLSHGPRRPDGRRATATPARPASA